MTFPQHQPVILGRTPEITQELIVLHQPIFLMAKKMRKRVLLFFMLLASSITFAGNEPSILPRLWEARAQSDKGITTVFYILASSHLGLPTEYDRYFDDVILPRFKSSEMLWYEGAGGREFEPIPKCDSRDLDEDGRKALKNMRQIAADRYYESQKFLFETNHVSEPWPEDIKKKYAVGYIDSLDEFDLIQANYLAFSTIAQYKQRKHTERTSEQEQSMFRGSVVARLLSETPGIATYDLDSRFGVRRAYCTAGPRRISFMADQIQGTDLGEESISQKWFSIDKEFSSFVASSGKSKIETMSLPGLEPTFTCKRNEEWIDSILRHLDGKIHFVAVGAAHMFDIERPGLKCPGILTLLTAKGLNPVLIPLAQ